MIKIIKKNQGFTLVETLVAIAILMVAVAGPLTVANQALTTALGSRDAMIATYLAQDGMESIKNIKDNDSVNAFNNGILSVSNCTSDHPCQTPVAWSNNGTYFAGNVSPCSPNCKIYIDNSGNNGYVYDNSGSPTPFIRSYYVSKGGPIAGTIFQDVIVTVKVDWNEGSIPNEIKLQEVMSNVPR